MDKVYRFEKPEIRFNELKKVVERAIGRVLEEEEISTIEWISKCEPQTSQIIRDLFIEANHKSEERL